MDVYAAIRTVLAVRSYKDQPLSPESVRRIIEAGRLTASSLNRQPWHFVVVEDKAMLRELGGLARSGPYIAEAALAIAVAVERSSIFGVSDASRAIQNMMLAAWEEGIGSNWVGFSGLESAAAALGIPPAMDLLALVPFGFPKTRLAQGKKNRKSLGEVVSRERYGQPFT
jgi:nitroreductase